ncbi:MAG TPA: T9SS type A sorting domain-containing protein [Chryseosolibacter sp.]
MLAVVRKLNDPSCTNETAGRVRIEVIAGKAPFRYTMKSNEAAISREWKQSTLMIEHAELGKGDYVLTLKDGANETLERKFKLTMPDALTITLGPDQKYSVAEPIVLNVSSQVPTNVPVTYRWENSFGFSSAAKSITVTEPAVYKVYVTKESDGCVFTDDIAITGASEQRLAVFPTLVRAEDTFSVGISLERPAAVAVQVMTSSGLLLERSNGTGNSEYQFTYIAKNPGLYLVVIQTPAGIETRKVVVQ